MKILLHVGSGIYRIDSTTKGFNDGTWKELRLDIDPSVQPDILGSILNLSGVDSKSVSAIYSSHNIEHLYAHEIPKALSEFLRVLTPDGFCVITCPDLKSVCALVAEDRLTDCVYHSPAGPITPLDILYGHRSSLASGNLFMAHKSGFTEKFLRESLQSAGFQSIATMTRKNQFDIWALATKSNLPEDDIKNLALQHFVRN